MPLIPNGAFGCKFDDFDLEKNVVQIFLISNFKNIITFPDSYRGFKTLKTMNFNNFTIKAQEAVQKAVDLTQSNGQQVVETPHLLKAITLVGEDVVQFLYGKLGVNAPI